jgi:CBS domain-containing protein
LIDVKAAPAGRRTLASSIEQGSAMNAGEACNRETIVAYRDTTIVEAARLMRKHHVGSLVVVMDRAAERVPVGILTDRDIVVAVVAKERDPRTLAVGDVMNPGVLVVREQDGLPDAMRVMRERGVRRVPVVTKSGALAGILAMDDLLDLATEELENLVRTVKQERARETRARS